MSGRVFISYRRDDAKAESARLHDRLVAKFGAANVFMDVDALRPGQRFDVELAKALDQCDVFLAVIGPRWESVLMERQQRPERDYVLAEIAAALSRNIAVIPVLIDRTQLPSPAVMPPDIQGLLLHQKQEVTHERFGRDADNLIAAIRRELAAVAAKRRRATVHRLRPKLVGAAVAVAASAAGFFVWQNMPDLASLQKAAQPAGQDLANSGGGDVSPLNPFGASLSLEQTADRNLQRTKLWQVAKSEFPDWYKERLTEVVKLKGEGKGDSDIADSLIESLVAFRRQRSKDALAARSEKLTAVATTFLQVLKSLSKNQAETCYSFISRGEKAPVYVQLMGQPEESAVLSELLIAMLNAIADGGRTPSTYSSPGSSDYNQLSAELARLGWSNEDIGVFADPKKLAAESEGRVCKMIQDWFQAHLAIADGEVRSRLLAETLRAIVAG